MHVGREAGEAGRAKPNNAEMPSPAQPWIASLKGEESGHFQKLLALRTDCDSDVLLLAVEQVGGIACHTGRESCFYQELRDGRWQAVDPLLKNPEEIYQ